MRRWLCRLERGMGETKEVQKVILGFTETMFS